MGAQRAGRALGHASSGVELCPELDYAWPLAAGLATPAWIRQARGDPAGARGAMREAERALPDQRLVELFDPAPVQAPGWRWPRAGPPTPPAGCGTTAGARGRAHLSTGARIPDPGSGVIAEQTPDRALGLLERLHAAAAAQQRTGSVIEVRVMQALALAACDDEAGALAALADALTLAAPEGYVRVFVGDGSPMAALFARLMTARSARAMLAGGVPVDYLGRLREDLHPDGGSLRGPCGSPLGSPRARPSH